ncbi:secreted protein [Plectosphaerella plurivora]|uniref:Secreted protein n=1 Tax=Plectosphaerella plurivora TaxID=936078 RepID=A0A9P8V1C9_9PEZI|nr:secreted protein [Plectosphaerella plurivora]
MYWSSVLAAFVGLAAAVPMAPVPPPSKVKIHGVTLIGSGCPYKDSAKVLIDETKTLFEVGFSEYIVSSGKGKGASDWRKNCKLSINMEFDAGYQFSIIDTSMTGYAQIANKGLGYCDNTFSFTGQRDKIVYPLTIKGPYQGDFELHASPGISSYSPCGGSTAILNLNTQCRLSPTNLESLIAVDSVGGSLTVLFAIQWQKCGHH